MPLPVHLEFDKEPSKDTPWAAPATPDALASHAPAEPRKSSFMSKLAGAGAWLPSMPIIISSTGQRAGGQYDDQDAFSLPQMSPRSDLGPVSSHPLEKPPSSIKKLSGMRAPPTFSPLQSPGPDNFLLPSPLDTPGGRMSQHSQGTAMTPPSLGETPGGAMTTPGPTPGPTYHLPTDTDPTVASPNLQDAMLGSPMELMIDTEDVRLAEDFNLGGENPNVQAALDQGFRSLTSGRSSGRGSAGGVGSGVATPGDERGYRKLDGALTPATNEKRARRRGSSSKFGNIFGLVRAPEEKVPTPGGAAAAASMAEAFGLTPMGKRNHARDTSNMSNMSSFQDASSSLTGSADAVAPSAAHVRKESEASIMQYGSAVSGPATSAESGDFQPRVESPLVLPPPRAPLVLPAARAAPPPSGEQTARSTVSSAASSDATRITRDSGSLVGSRVGGAVDGGLQLADFLGTRALGDSGSDLTVDSDANLVSRALSEGGSNMSADSSSVQEGRTVITSTPSPTRRFEAIQESEMQSLSADTFSPQQEGRTVIMSTPPPTRRFETIQESGEGGGAGGALPTLQRLNTGWGASLLQRVDHDDEEPPTSPGGNEDDALLDSDRDRTIY